MNHYFKQCLEKKTIIPFKQSEFLVNKELEESKKDLEDAKDVLKLGKVKLATISGYYSMFHAARALLYKKGYRERSHTALRIAITHLYEENEMLYTGWAEDFKHCMRLREEADYGGEYLEKNAKDVIASAEKSLKITRKILI